LQSPGLLKSGSATEATFDDNIQCLILGGITNIKLRVSVGVILTSTLPTSLEYRAARRSPRSSLFSLQPRTELHAETAHAA